MRQVEITLSRSRAESDRIFLQGVPRISLSYKFTTNVFATLTVRSPLGNTQHFQLKGSNDNHEITLTKEFQFGFLYVRLGGEPEEKVVVKIGLFE